MHTGTLPGIIIKLFTRYQYSHILISLDMSLTKMYSFGRKTLFNPLNAGFVIENIDGAFLNDLIKQSVVFTNYLFQINNIMKLKIF